MQEETMNTTLVNEIIEQVSAMPQHLQWQVLEFARTLMKIQIRGVPGKNLLRFAGLIPAEDLQLMSEAIEQDCGQVDFNEW